MNILSYLAYPPISRGALILILSGVIFPLVGIFVVRLHLVTFRFALMHTSLLGSAIALAVGLNPMVLGLGFNTLLILIVSLGGAKIPRQTGHLTVFFMVFTAGLAFAVLYRFDVPAMDSLGLLWGNIYALRPGDAWTTGVFALILLLFVGIFFRPIRAVLFDRDTAFSAGIPVNLVSTGILFAVGFTIQLVMSLIGALLLDAILILPALLAGITARSTRGLFFHASLWGFFVSTSGFFLSLAIDIPASSGLTLTGAGALGLLVLWKYLVQKTKKRSYL